MLRVPHQNLALLHQMTQYPLTWQQDPYPVVWMTIYSKVLHTDGRALLYFRNSPLVYTTRHDKLSQKQGNICLLVRIFQT
jgi:hypothetical protein